MIPRTCIAIVAAATIFAGCTPEPPQVIHLFANPAPSYVPEFSPSTYVPWSAHTIESRMSEIGPRARARWKRHFDEAATSYPPSQVEIVAFKRERRIEVYAGASPYHLALVRTLTIRAASGGPGPKLREGDRQVPEGIYALDSLNPNSAYHVSLRLAYPNEFDRAMAERDRRRNLGSDIMIHGSDRSIGCIAVGDEAAEDLFVLAADSGIENVSVVIVPRDFRRTGQSGGAPGQPRWVDELYARLDVELRSLPPPSPATWQSSASSGEDPGAR
ncbi:MAG TPA: L,D-transpeptidase family protein [Candidatus Binatia bacterium]|jgi:L,D-peptidoglycan transpeptidase YkuD (ErfK/YbiS/YcfS/YnhG family)